MYIQQLFLLARMDSESIAHEAADQMVHWHRGHEGERNNCFGKIHKTTLAS